MISLRLNTYGSARAHTYAGALIVYSYLYILASCVIKVLNCLFFYIKKQNIFNEKPVRSMYGNINIITAFLSLFFLLERYTQDGTFGLPQQVFTLRNKSSRTVYYLFCMDVCIVFAFCFLNTFSV